MPPSATAAAALLSRQARTAGPKGGTIVQELTGRWVKWRLETGQITRVTAKEQRYILAYFSDAMGARKVTQIGQSDLQRWLASMAHLSPGTVRHRYSTVRAFLEWCVDEGKIRRNPARRIPPPKVPRAVHRNLNTAQVAALHAACCDERERLIVELGFQLGLRRAEIAGVQVGDIDLHARSIRVVGKGGHERTVALTESARHAIDDYLVLHRIRAGPLVRNLGGTAGISPAWVGRIFEQVAYRAGVKQRPWDGVGTHSARHTAGTDVATSSKDLVVVRDFLGHASVQTTDRYIGTASLERQRDAIEGRSYSGSPGAGQVAA
jgi:integrase/recombinase XerC